jgi:three-Cys-motif partner protein
VTESEEFFTEQSEQSRIKAEIVEAYFWAWANVIIGTQKKYPNREQRIAYIDLFAGPGRYKDEAASTPVKIIQSAIEDLNIRDRLVAVFNDKDPTNTRSLQTCLEALPGYEGLRFKPKIYTSEITQEVIRDFEQRKLVPTFLFVDPWGYKGLSLRLVNAVLKDWGCDCVFFFNYNRINAGISNPAVDDHMNALFGADRANRIRNRLGSRNAPEPDPSSAPHGAWKREQFIVEEMCAALKEMGGKFVLPFRFRNENGTRTTHHLFFVTKHFKGYDIMKGILHNHSSRKEEGVARFEYNPADAGVPTLFEFVKQPSELEGMVLAAFIGQSVSRKELYETHSVGRPFLERHYTELLLRLETEGKVQIHSTKRRISGKVPTDAMIVFPQRATTV